MAALSSDAAGFAALTITTMSSAACAGPAAVRTTDAASRNRVSRCEVMVVPLEAKGRLDGQHISLPRAAQMPFVLDLQPAVQTDVVGDPGHHGIEIGNEDACEPAVALAEREVLTASVGHRRPVVAQVRMHLAAHDVCGNLGNPALGDLFEARQIAEGVGLTRADVLEVEGQQPRIDDREDVQAGFAKPDRSGLGGLDEVTELADVLAGDSSRPSADPE